MVAGLTQSTKETIQVGGAETHGFSAAEVPGGVANKYCRGNPRQAERDFGWRRDAVNTGLNELRTGIPLPRCFRIAWAAQERRRSAGVSAGDSRAGRTAEPGRPEIPDAAGLHANDGQGGSAAAAGRFQGAAAGGFRPSETVHDILNRLGYRLRRVRKTRPQKRSANTDAIFANLRQVQRRAAQEPATLRISLDTKAKVKIGRFSRGGVARGRQCVAAADHDMHPDAVLTPAGILEVDRHQLNLVFGTSRDTSDFVPTV